VHGENAAEGEEDEEEEEGKGGLDAGAGIAIKINTMIKMMAIIIGLSVVEEDRLPDTMKITNMTNQDSKGGTMTTIIPGGRQDMKTKTNIMLSQGEEAKGEEEPANLIANLKQAGDNTRGEDMKEGEDMREGEDSDTGKGEEEEGIIIEITETIGIIGILGIIGIIGRSYQDQEEEEGIKMNETVVNPANVHFNFNNLTSKLLNI